GGMPDFAALQAQPQHGGTGSVAGAGTAATAASAANPSTPAQPVSTQTAMDVLGKLQTAASSSGSRHSMADIRNAMMAQVKAE
ncbi:MAG: hypothetical protein RR326_08370, partial [Stenotrophomonas sp.]